MELRETGIPWLGVVAKENMLLITGKASESVRQGSTGRATEELKDEIPRAHALELTMLALKVFRRNACRAHSRIL